VTTTPVTTDADAGSRLEQSRARSQKARQALTDAQRQVDDVEARIGRNTAMTSASENALRSAEAEVKRLKKALKDSDRERRKLVVARKRAQAEVAKAAEKIRKTEAKYDRAVLADLIQRQKEEDRRGSSGTGVSAPREALPAPDGPLALNGAEPAREPEDLATATARTTAARVTAATAGEGAEPAPKPPTTRRTSTTGRSRSSRA
jgi:hypothetical protein